MRRLVLGVLAAFALIPLAAGLAYHWTRRPPPQLRFSVEGSATAVAGQPFDVIVDVRDDSERPVRGSFRLQIARESPRRPTLLSAAPSPLERQKRGEWEDLLYPIPAAPQRWRGVLRFKARTAGASRLRIRLAFPEGVYHGVIELPLLVQTAPGAPGESRPAAGATPR
jgi:hypothetical protein